MSSRPVASYERVIAPSREWHLAGETPKIPRAPQRLTAAAPAGFSLPERLPRSTRPLTAIIVRDGWPFALGLMVGAASVAAFVFAAGVLLP